MRRWLLRTTPVLLVALLATASAVPAAAKEIVESGGDTNAGCVGADCSVGAHLHIPGSHGQGAAGSSGSGPALTCLYFASEADSREPAMSLDSFTPGDTVWVRCWLDPDTLDVPYGSAWTITWLADTPAVPALPVEDVAQWALERMRVPLPEPTFNPAGDQIVQLPTLLHVTNWSALTQTASAGGVSATVTARPWRQRWNFGADGATAVCYGPGVAYDPGRPESAQNSNCAATFTHVSRGQPGNAFAATVSVDWQVTWTSTVAGRGGDLGLLSTTATRQIRVGEIQVLNS
jgi:hypothetical protein